jgi:hypothetical protein
MDLTLDHKKQIGSALRLHSAIIYQHRAATTVIAAVATHTKEIALALVTSIHIRKMAAIIPTIIKIAVTIHTTKATIRSNNAIS